MSVAGEQISQPKERHHSFFRVYLWILSYVKPYFLSVILLILAGIVASGGELFIPKIIQHFIDEIFPAKDYEKFFSISIVLLVVIVLIILSTMAQTLLQRTLSERASRDLRFAVFCKTRELGVPFFESHPTGQTLSMINNEVSSIQEIYRNYLPTILQYSIYSIISITIMTSISIKLTFVMVPIFILYYLIGPYFARKAVIYGRQSSESSIGLHKQIYDSVSALKELRANGMQEWNLSHHESKLNQYLSTYLRSNLFSFLRGSVRRFCNNLGAVAIFAYGSVLSYNNELSVGEVVVFILNYYYTIFVLTKIISLAAEQQQLMFQGELLHKFMFLKSKVNEREKPIILDRLAGNIKFENAWFGYNTEKMILRNFNLEIRAGENIALVGMSGNGKSTVLKLVARFYDPQFGEITIDGTPIRDLSLNLIRQSIGVVFQETYLFGKTIRDNIAFGKQNATEEEIIAAAKAAYAHDFITMLPDGYNTVVGERGIKLSGGERQRISIARVYIKNPSIILLDEATSALDNVSEQLVQKALNQLMKDKTTIVVAHRLETIKHSNRILVLDNGGIIESGNYYELIEQKGKFFNLVNGEIFK